MFIVRDHSSGTFMVGREDLDTPKMTGELSLYQSVGVSYEKKIHGEYSRHRLILF